MKKLFSFLLLVCATVSAFADDLTFTVVNTTTGFTTGSIDMNVSGGIAPFTYSWSGPSGFSATTEDLSGLATGTYTVTVTDAYCGTATTTIFVDATTGINENANAASIGLYPNPANDQITVTSGTAMKNGTVMLIDLNGKIVSEAVSVSGNTFSLNVSGLAKGIYFVEINSEGIISRKRFVKN